MTAIIRTKFPEAETYMQSCMTDSAHDREHIYRVLNYALGIARHEGGVNIDVLAIACLLHDIGRAEQFADPTVCHAVYGAEKAYSWLTENGHEKHFADAVKDCIQTHRFRSENPPQSIEAKILFDADKLDVCGAMGIARTLFYAAHVSAPLYSLTENCEVCDGTNDTEPSFLREYKYKLENMYDNFYTKRGAELAAKRKAAAENYYASLLSEARECYSIKDFCVQHIDGVPFKLKSPFDFSFLSKYGKVFKVFDNQGSGNICFGMADGDQKYFVKFAGAPTENYSGTAGDAVERLKRAVPAYRDLAHPNLIRLIMDEEIGGGYAVVFDWVNALYMWDTDGGQEFRRLPLKVYHKMFGEILSFHKNMAEKGYCALDFYEDHIMWDTDNEKAVICDIDFYSKGWYEGMSGIWNTDCEWYFPEQFIDGAKFDEVSCVYIMGATAFAFFGDGRDRRIEKWKLSKELFDIAKRAVSNERAERQQSIEQLIAEWRAAKL